MAVSFYSIMTFFSSEEKLVLRAENALKSNRLIKFTYDGTSGIVIGKVQPSMKTKISYDVRVSTIYCCTVCYISLIFHNLFYVIINELHCSLYYANV